MAKITVVLLAGAAFLVSIGCPAGAAPFIAPDGLRAGFDAAALIERVNGRRPRAVRCVCPGARYGSLIIEPGVRAPRAYYADYYEYAARYGWWF
jgi:hypothetical protein